MCIAVIFVKGIHYGFEYHKIHTFENEIHDFSDTAALCELMDVVISVDTSVAHLAGALGKPLWMLIPYVPDWRWMLDRADSPWYPTATLYRQTTRGDWESVLHQIHDDLQALPVAAPAPSQLGALFSALRWWK